MYLPPRCLSCSRIMRRRESYRFRSSPPYASRTIGKSRVNSTNRRYPRLVLCLAYSSADDSFGSWWCLGALRAPVISQYLAGLYALQWGIDVATVCPRLRAMPCVACVRYLVFGLLYRTVPDGTGRFRVALVWFWGYMSVGHSRTVCTQVPKADNSDAQPGHRFIDRDTI